MTDGLTLRISADGLSVDKDPDSFHVGPPGNTVTICVLNEDANDSHQVRLEKITHRRSGARFDPLTGPKNYLVLAGGKKCRDHKVKRDAWVDPYDYVVVLDTRELDDPEIVVDPPLIPPKKKKKKKKKKKRRGAATGAKGRTTRRRVATPARRPRRG